MKSFLIVFALPFVFVYNAHAQQKPNVIFILADDLGYGDISCYGSKIIKTPNLDKLAENGLKFMNAHATSPTCTPSRYAIITGRYPWRQTGTRILPGDAKLIIPLDKITLPKVFKNAGYTTAIAGKWHLGLGNEVSKNWNGEIKPGPNETGFDYSFIFPATADRVPTVFIENHRVVAAEDNDPIAVSYEQKVGNDPTGKDHPELLKLKSSHGHDETIINGIGRIGFMSGGNQTRWVDEEIGYTFLDKAKQFIEAHKTQSFFLYYALTEPHVPRMPATQFKGKSGLGYRGDAILQLDWAVGEIMKCLQANDLVSNTIIIFSSDNGPVLDDGYQDGAATAYHGEQLGGLRGGKNSILEGGTRVPFIISWQNKILPGISNALMSQMDFLASFAAMFTQNIPQNDSIDSEDHLDALLGKSKQGREVLMEGNTTQKIAIIKGNWKYIEPNNYPPYDSLVAIETGNSKAIQLYNLKNDVGEKNNLADKYPDKVKALQDLLKQEENKIKQSNRPAIEPSR